jgi:hypothetical protein
MSLHKIPWVVVLLLTACGGGRAILPADLLVRLEVDAKEVELGKAFPVTVVRVWRKDLLPAAWDDAALAPLVVRLEAVTRREDDQRIEETRRYRGYAFTLRDVTIGPLEISARPQDGGPAQVVQAEAFRLRVRPALDAKAPGPVELPGEPLSEPYPWTLWILGLAAVLAALTGGLVLRTRRRPAGEPPALPVPVRARPDLHALERLSCIRERMSEGAGDILSDVVESSAVMRDYLSEQFLVRAWVKTTEELVASPETASMAKPPLRDALAEFLTQCDRAKFAAHVPSARERAHLLDAAEAFVRRTGSAES